MEDYRLSSRVESKVDLRQGSPSGGTHQSQITIRMGVDGVIYGKPDLVIGLQEQCIVC